MLYPNQCYMMRCVIKGLNYTCFVFLSQINMRGKWLFTYIIFDTYEGPIDSGVGRMLDLRLKGCWFLYL